MSVNSFTKHEPLIFKTGSNIKLIHRAEYYKSIIADGKELITGDEYGEIRVPELNDEKVYITFKEDVTDLSYAFFGCLALKSIPENLFANCPEVTDISRAFEDCWALKSIPSSLFDNNRKVTSFSETFRGCTAFTGESPYTMIGDKKVHLYERVNYPDHFTEPTVFWDCFYDSTDMRDYIQAPDDWKE